MFRQFFPDGAEQAVRRFEAFGRAFFVHEFGGEHRDQHSGPVGDGVAEECAPVRAGIVEDVEDDPEGEDCAGDDA